MCFEYRRIFHVLTHSIDTLLNVFLAIAVDNLANAQELTAAEQEQEQKDEQVRTQLWQHLILKSVGKSLVYCGTSAVQVSILWLI